MFMYLFLCYINTYYLVLLCMYAYMYYIYFLFIFFNTYLAASLLIYLYIFVAIYLSIRYVSVFISFALDNILFVVLFSSWLTL
jgi:hypothetical protein